LAPQRGRGLRAVLALLGRQARLEAQLRERRDNDGPTVRRWTRPVPQIPAYLPPTMTPPSRPAPALGGSGRETRTDEEQPSPKAARSADAAGSSSSASPDVEVVICRLKATLPEDAWPQGLCLDEWLVAMEGYVRELIALTNSATATEVLFL
jgi:hypothetical protein